MNNREEIKWAPFQSIVNTNTIIKELELQKKVQQKPILSSDNLEEIERNILNALHTKSKIKIDYYYNGFIYHKIGIINRIDQNTFKIYFKDYSSLYFEQILKIQFI